jgi:polyhydroxyalkanoate synthesis regulator phasin
MQIVDNNDLINELIKSGKFTKEEAIDFISKTMPNGDDSDNIKRSRRQ